MTDTPDYTKRNPKVLLGNTAVAPVLQIFNADGTPHLFEEPSNAEEEAFLNHILIQVDGQDIRRVLSMLQNTEMAIQRALFHALTAAHMVAHSPQYNAGYDEETLCEGVHAYLDPERAYRTHEREEAIDVADILQRFFIKPDQKPN